MNTPRTTLLGAAVVAACCGSALAQNAIGSGTALDRNLQTGTIGVNQPTRDLSAEIRLRNAVITGNAPAGMSFRGGTPYQSPGEFMGFLGSNTLFRFRRDSVFSGAAGMGIRGTDALQYQFAMTTGNTPPPGLTGPGLVERSGAGATGLNIAARDTGAFRTNVPVTEIRPGEKGADTRGEELWTLRSPSGFVATRGLSPSMVAVVQGAEGQQVGIMASPLNGLFPTAIDSFPRPQPKEEPRPEPLPGSAVPLELRTNLAADLKAPEEQPVTRSDFRADMRPGLSGYDDLVKRLSTALPEPGQGDPSKLPLWQRRVNEVRRQLEEAEKRRAAFEPAEPAEEEGPLTPSGFRADTLKLLRESGVPITRLATEGVDAYALHMKRGEEYLAQGQYFFAEERFKSALSVKPDDPMAAIGRVHAQLGASLFASAAMNLRMLLISHPELISAKYGPEVLPDRARIQRIIERLDGMITSGRGVGRDTGLLLAYLGHQLGDQAIVERGLKVMEGTGGDAVPDTQLLKLSGLLREIWLKPAEPGK